MHLKKNIKSEIAEKMLATPLLSMRGRGSYMRKLKEKKAEELASKRGVKGQSGSISAKSLEGALKSGALKKLN